MIPVEATKEWALVRYGAWPEDLDSDGALRETENALAHVVNNWIEIRLTYRKVMLDLTRTPFGRAKEMAKIMQSRVDSVLSRLDKARGSVSRELSDLTKKRKTSPYPDRGIAYGERGAEQFRRVERAGE